MPTVMSAWIIKKIYGDQKKNKKSCTVMCEESPANNSKWYRLCWAENVPDLIGGAIADSWSFLQSPDSSSSQTPAHETGTYSKPYTLQHAEMSSCSVLQNAHRTFIFHDVHKTIITASYRCHIKNAKRHLIAFNYCKVAESLCVTT